MALLITSLTNCSSSRPPIPPGVVPVQGSVLSEDEQYGHEVLNNLTQTYPLDRDDNNNIRVTDIVEKLTKAAKSDHNPWHVFVLKDDNFKNAAATRGNYIFVWTGILKTVQNDNELATILAHEIGHVLAGHTAVDPMEETARIIAGVAGATSGGFAAASGYGGPVADLAELLIRSTLEAFILNPTTQAKELEADQVGLFLMADAGYDPELAIRFWERVKNDPDFGGSSLEFISSHPSSDRRAETLATFLPDAQLRYEAATGKRKSKIPAKETSSGKKLSKASANTWTVMESNVSVYKSEDDSSEVVGNLKYNTSVTIKRDLGRWLEIENPYNGFVRSKDLAPK